MGKWIRYYQVILAGLIGSILAIVLFSLGLSAYQVSQGILKWSDLNNIGGFWNGHVGMFALLVIALGIYVQARQFESQLNIERQERLDLRREHAYTMLELIEAKINQLRESLLAYQIERTDSGKANCFEFKGIWAILDALRNERRRRTEDYEVWIDERVLTAYVRALQQRQAIWEKITSLNQELGDISQDSFYSNEAAISGEQEITSYLNYSKEKRDKFMEELRGELTPAPVLETLETMVQSGWRISVNQAATNWYITARCFASDRKAEIPIYSDGFSEKSEAYKQVTKEWLERFAG